jgi:hypothetical protein
LIQQDGMGMVQYGSNIQFFTMPSIAIDETTTGWCRSEAASVRLLFRFLAGYTATLLGQVA